VPVGLGSQQPAIQWQPRAVDALALVQPDGALAGGVEPDDLLVGLLAAEEGGEV